MADQTSVILERANSALIARDFTYAEKFLLNLMRQNEDSIDVLSLLGAVYLRSDNLEKALSVFKKLSAIVPGDVEILNNLGIIYRRLERFEESIAALKEARSTGKDFDTVLYNLGNTYKQMGRYDDAARCFAEVIDNKPDDVLAYNHLGSIHAPAACMIWRSRPTGAGCRLTESYFITTMAHSYDKLNRPQEAITEFTLALKTNQDGLMAGFATWPPLFPPTGRSKLYCDASPDSRRRSRETRALLEMGTIAARKG